MQPPVPVQTLAKYNSRLPAIRGYFMAYSLQVADPMQGENSLGSFSQFYEGLPPPSLPPRPDPIFTGPVLGIGVGIFRVSNSIQLS